MPNSSSQPISMKSADKECRHHAFRVFDDQQSCFALQAWKSHRVCSSRLDKEKVRNRNEKNRICCRSKKLSSRTSRLSHLLYLSLSPLSLLSLSSSWQKCSLDHVMHNWPAKRIFCGIHISSVKYHLTLTLTSPTLKCKQTSWTSCLDWNWSFLCEAITVRIQGLFLSFFLLRSISIQLRENF